MLILACEETKQMCCNIFPFLKILKLLILVIQFSVPLVLIILGTIEMIKVVTSGEEKVSQEVIKNFSKRLIYAVVIFLVPYLINLVLTFLNNEILKGELKDDITGPVSWLTCWNKVELKENNYCSECDIYNGDSQNSENQGEIVDEMEDELNNLTKTCYVYKKNQLSCQDGYYLYNDNKCYEVLPLNKSYACNDANSYYGYYKWISDANVCINMNNSIESMLTLKELASSKLPNTSSDGIVKIYSCPISVSSCNDYSSCTYQQDIPVDSE